MFHVNFKISIRILSTFCALHWLIYHVVNAKWGITCDGGFHIVRSTGLNSNGFFSSERIWITSLYYYLGGERCVCPHNSIEFRWTKWTIHSKSLTREILFHMFTVKFNTVKRTMTHVKDEYFRTYVSDNRNNRVGCIVSLKYSPTCNECRNISVCLFVRLFLAKKVVELPSNHMDVLIIVYNVHHSNASFQSLHWSIFWSKGELSWLMEFLTYYQHENKIIL